jgi:HlyD family secretion protein
VTTLAMNVSLRRLGIAAGMLLLGASGYAYFLLQDHPDAGFVTERLERGPVVSTVTASGTVNPVTTVQVGTYVSGPIKAIYADFNSRVSKGQIVAKIDPAPFQVKVQSSAAAVANAKAKVLKAQADLALKKLTYERNQKLLDRTLVSQNDLDTAKSGYDQAVAQLALDVAGVQQAKADLDAAKIQLAYTDITSPVDGVVVSRSVDVGQTVAASFQTPTLFLIAQDLTKMQVDANVSESDIGNVTTGQAVTFRVDAYPDRDFHGKVVQVRNAPINVQNVVTYDVVVAFDNPKLELRPGMTATITITTAEAADALRIPVRALRFRPERSVRSETNATRSSLPTAALASLSESRRQQRHSPAVFVPIEEGGLKRVEVQTGVQNESYAALLSGELQEGDLVIIGYKRPETAPSGHTQRPPSFMGGGGSGRRFH